MKARNKREIANRITDLPVMTTEKTLMAKEKP
jgi:hypothetical protein